MCSADECAVPENMGLSAGTGKRCVFGHLGLVFISSCYVFLSLFLLFYVISPPVPAIPGEKPQRIFEDLQGSLNIVRDLQKIFEDEDLSRILEGSLKVL